MSLFMVFGVLSAISLLIMLLDKFVLPTKQAAKQPAYVAFVYSWGSLFIMVFVILLLIRYFNFTLILTLATLFALIVAVIDKLFLVSKRKVAVKAYIESVEVPDEQLVKELRQGPALIEFVRSLFPVLLAVFILRSFVVEPFQIPSGSMKPTLDVGDFILVNKFAYGIRLPVIDKTIIPIGKPQHGDVVVFHYPPNPEIDYIKRLIGVPGDRIQYTADKRLLINGQLIDEQYIGTESDVEVVERYNELLGRTVQSKESFEYSRYKENFMGVQHDIYKIAARGSYSIKPNSEWIVPEGYYFMMGDNRDNSKDSRFWIEDYLKKANSQQEFNKLVNDDKMYMVPADNIVGKAFLVWMHWPDSKLQHIPSFTSVRVIK